MLKTVQKTFSKLLSLSFFLKLKIDFVLGSVERSFDFFNSFFLKVNFVEQLRQKSIFQRLLLHLLIHLPLNLNFLPLRLGLLKVNFFPFKMHRLFKRIHINFLMTLNQRIEFLLHEILPLQIILIDKRSKFFLLRRDSGVSIRIEWLFKCLFAN